MKRLNEEDVFLFVTPAVLALLAVIFCLLLTACAGAPPKERIVTQRVEVPISQPCRPALGPKPVYPTEQAPVATDVFDQMKTLLAERELRIAREIEQDAALAGCAGQ